MAISLPCISHASGEKISWALSGMDTQSEAAKYRTVQQQITRAVAVPHSHGIYAIPDTSHTAPSLIEIHLTSASGAIATLYMSSDNMYIQGFSIGNGARYATADADLSGLYQGFTNAGFSSDYAQMQSMAGVEDMGLWGLGAGALDTLVHNINFDAAAKNQATFRRTSARLLLTAALMFGGGTRFSPSFGTEISLSIENGLPYLPTLSDQELIRDWGNLSRWGRATAQNPTQTPLQLSPHVYANPHGFTFHTEGTQTITSLLSLSWLIGILAYSPPAS